MSRSRRATIAAVTTLLLTVWAALPAEGALAVRSSGSASVNRSANAGANANRSAGANANRSANANASANRGGNASANRNANVNGNANVNRNVNYNSDVNINRDVDIDSDYHGGCCGCCHNEHPVAGAMAVTAAVSLTAAAIGSIVASPPPNCAPVAVNGLTYQQCGGTWYQPQMSGGSTTYVVVNPPQ